MQPSSCHAAEGRSCEELLTQCVRLRAMWAVQVDSDEEEAPQRREDDADVGVKEHENP